MVQSGGFEPPAFGATSRRSNQLSYDCTLALGLSAIDFHFKHFSWENSQKRRTALKEKAPLVSGAFIKPIIARSNYAGLKAFNDFSNAAL